MTKIQDDLHCWTLCSGAYCLPLTTMQRSSKPSTRVLCHPYLVWLGFFDGNDGCLSNLKHTESLRSKVLFAINSDKLLLKQESAYKPFCFLVFYASVRFLFACRCLGTKSRLKFLFDFVQSIDNLRPNISSDK